MSIPKKQTKVKIPLKSLDSLTQQEIVDIANNLIELKEAGKYKTLEKYLESAHEDQFRFHKDTHRIRIITAPNRQGKTTAGAAELIWANLGNHPFKKCKVPIKSAVVLQDFETHGKKIFEPKINEWAPKGSIKKIERHQGGCIRQIQWITGSTTDVYSHDQEMKVFEGSDFDLIWFDEPPPKAIWSAMWRGCIDRGGLMYMTGTPLWCVWLYEEYQKWKSGLTPIQEFIEFGRSSNLKNIGEGDIELGKKRMDEFESMLDPEERDARREGSFSQLRGLIFKNWDRGIHLIEEFPISPHWQIIESIDPHPSKPWAVSWVAIAKNGAKILLQSYLFDGTIDEIASQIILARDEIPHDEGIELKIKRTLIDNSASVPTWQKSYHDPTARRVSVREELQNIIGPRGAGGPIIEVCPKNVQGKIDLMKSWLHVKDHGGVKRPDFFAFDGERNYQFIKEIENYVWDRVRKKDGAEIVGRPVKKNDDVIDTVMQIALTLKQSKLEDSGPIDMILGTNTYGLGGLHDNRGSHTFKTRRDSFS